MTRIELKTAAKEQISGNIGLLFVMFLILIAINVICSLIPFIGPIALFVINPVFSLALCAIFLKLSKKEEIKIGNLFDCFNQTGRALWLNILISVFTFLWSLLLVIPGIIKAYSYSMAFFILADNPELTASEALTKSKEIMNGHKLDLFILHLSFFWWYLLVNITFGLAAIYVVPYMSATITNFYNSIK